VTAPDPRARRAQRSRRPGAAPAPLIDVISMTRVPAGRSVVVRVRVRNAATARRVLSLSPLGLDEQWMPAPQMLGPYEPGVAVELDLVFSPPVGTLSGRYPFSVSVQAMNPDTLAVDPIIGVAEGVLSVDEPSHLLLGIEPSDLRGVRRATAKLTIRNNGEYPVRVDLAAETGSGLAIDFGAQGIELGPNEQAATRARITIATPRLLGKRVRHPFAIIARADGAGERVGGALIARPVFSGSAMGVLSLVLVVCLWAGLAFLAVGAISDHYSKNKAANLAITQTQPVTGASPGGTGGGTGGGGTGGGGGGSGGSGGVPGNAGALPGVRFAGSMTGAAAAGVDVQIEPTSLVDEKAEGAQRANGSRYERIDPGAVGKLSASSLRLTLLAPVASDMSTVTAGDGAWAFPPVSAPGYYLLTFSKAGYQTKRFVVNAVDGSNPDPMKVELSPGAGRLSGTITGPAGGVGSAAITITDGTHPLTTSSNSTDAPGTWAIDGLSTPGTYLVTAVKEGLGSESGLVTLSAAGVATVDLALLPGVAAITGTVSGYNSRGAFGGVGHVSVTATDGDLVRTTSTVTGGSLPGSFVLPQLPTPAAYSVTISAPGYQSQTQQIVIGAGASPAPVNVTLTSDSGTVQGSVVALDAHGNAPGVQAGTAVTLANAAGVAYKTLTNNDGVFTFNGVAPGSYTVAASRFGNETSYASVEVTTGIQPALAPFTLPFRNETPETALIVGRVVDARSGGELCNRLLFKELTCTGYTVTLSGSAIPGPSAVPTSTAAIDLPQSYSDTQLAAFGYQLPNLAASGAGAGLAPGSYTVTVSAAGYESARVQVQVPLGARITAPQIALYPTATLTGLVLPAIGEPNAPTCVTATKLDGQGTPVPACTVTGTGDAAVASCSATRSSGEPAAPAPEVLCAVVSTRDATQAEIAAGVTRIKNGYRIPNLSAGSYFVQIFTTDPEYVPPQTSTVVVALGEVKNYDTTINRLARATITVLVPDRSTGSLTAAGGATVTIGNGTAAQDQSGVTPTADDPNGTNRKGVVTFTGLAPATYGVNVTSPDGSGSQGGIGVSYNQELQITVSITKASTGFVGKVLIAATVMIGGSLVTNPGANGASVTVSGIVGYTNSVPTSASLTVPTDANGCFAILPADSAPLPASAVCPTVDAGSRRTLNLLTDTVSIAVAQTTPSQPVAQQNYSTASGAVVITAQPKGNPVSNGLLEVSRAGPWLLANANIQVISAAPGAAGVTITPNSAGVLTWSDPNFATGSARPGVYKIRATLTGFDDSKVITVNVPLAGGAVTFADGSGNPANPTLTPYSTIAIAVVDTAGNPVPNADVTLSGTTIGSVRKSPTTGGNQVSFDALSTLPTYSATIRVAGYAFTDLTPQTATCRTTLGGTQVGADYTLTSATLTAPPNGDTATCSIALTPLGSITGILRGKLLSDDPTLTDLSGSQVVARKCSETANAGSPITANCTVITGGSGESFPTTTGTHGAFTITGSTTAPGLSSGYWQITVTTNGYQTYVRGVPVLQQAAPACAGTLDPGGACVAQVDSLKVLLTFTLSDSAGTAITDAVVTLRKLDGTVLATRDHSSPPAAGQPAWTNSYVFAAVDPTTYSLSVVAAGKAPLNVNTITLTLGQTIQTYPLVLGSTANGISGGVYGQKPGGSTAPLAAHVTINDSQTALSASTGTDGQPMEALTTVSNPANATTDGTYHILNVPNGTWYVHVVADLYMTQVQSKAVSGGAQELANFQLTAVNHPVAVTLVSTNGFDLNGATAELSATQACAVPTPDPAALTQPLVRPGGAGTTYAASFLSQLPGTYYLRVTQPAGHLAPLQDCQAVVVPSESGSPPPAAVGFEITEYRLLLKVATDPTAGSPTNVPIAVTGTTIAFSPTIPATGAAVGTTYAAFVPGTAYDITATPDPTAYPDWPAVTKNISAYVSAAPASAGPSETITVTQQAKVTVTVTRDGAPIAAGDVQATVTLKTGATTVATATTAAGLAQFGQLTPGTPYTASALLSDGGTYTAGPSTAVTPGVGVNAPIALNLVTVGAATVAVVAGPPGATVPGGATATVQLKADCTPASAEVRPATAAAADGKVAFTGLPPGTYGMFAVFGGNTNDCTTVTITVGATANATVRVVNYGSLAVTVTSGLTAVGSTATVQLRTGCGVGDTDLPGATVTTSGGVATFPNLVAGTYGFVGKIAARTSLCVSAAVTARGSATGAVVVPEA
jgi:hypothetical protein